MVVAVVGSRTLTVTDLERYLPPHTTSLVSGGAMGVDQAAAAYARRVGLPIREIVPDYNAFGKKAPLLRNELIVKVSDMVLAFWDGVSHGTVDTVGHCRRLGVPCIVYMPTGMGSYYLRYSFPGQRNP